MIIMDTVTFSKALADETRQKIMNLCCCCWLNVGQIVNALEVSQPTVSHHLSILKEAGLVEVRRAGKETFYTLNQDRLASGCCLLADRFAPDLTLSLVRSPGES
jgi:ArsR family transcriptional regulator, arsenate/arsenite/antimonite-responsive transcriptional repressor